MNADPLYQIAGVGWENNKFEYQFVGKVESKPNENFLDAMNIKEHVSVQNTVLWNSGISRVYSSTSSLDQL